MTGNIVQVVNDILNRFGTDILLDSSRFCAILDDMAPELDTERKVFRNMQRLNLLPKIYHIMQKDTAPIQSGRIDILLKDEGFSPEWRRIALEAFGYEIEQKPTHQESPDEQYEKGNCYYYGRGVQRDYAEAVKWYRMAAEQGHSGAQNNLGVCYRSGIGVQQDYEQAVIWYRKAAEQGRASAQLNLGNCYHNGYGVQQDYAEAVKWIRKAAEQGDTAAQFWLGICYENGHGVQQDTGMALQLYEASAKQNFKPAAESLERLKKSSRPEANEQKKEGLLKGLFGNNNGTHRSTFSIKSVRSIGGNNVNDPFPKGVYSSVIEIQKFKCVYFHVFLKKPVGINASLNLSTLIYDSNDNLISDISSRIDCVPRYDKFSKGLILRGDDGSSLSPGKYTARIRFEDSEIVEYHFELV